MMGVSRRCSYLTYSHRSSLMCCSPPLICSSHRPPTKTSVMAFANTTVAMSNGVRNKVQAGTNRVFAGEKDHGCPLLSTTMLSPTTHRHHLLLPPLPKTWPSLQAADAYAAAAAVRRTGSRRATVAVAGSISLSGGAA